MQKRNSIIIITLVVAIIVTFKSSDTGNYYVANFLTKNSFLESYLKAKVPPNEHFVFLNTFDSPTDSITNWVSIISQYKPKAIVIDIMLGDTLPDFGVVNNVPIIYGIGLDEVPPIITDQKNVYFGTIDAFKKDYWSKGLMQEIISLPLQVIKQTDLVLYNELIKRNDSELINYSIKPQSSFHIYKDYISDQIMTKKIIEDRIVLVGYLGSDDAFFEPSYLDKDVHPTLMGNMYGVVILANVIYTYTGNMIYEPSGIIYFLSLCLMAFFTTFFISKLKLRNQLFLVLIVQIIFILIAAFLILLFIFLADYSNVIIDYGNLLLVAFIAAETALIYRLGKNSIELKN